MNETAQLPRRAKGAAWRDQNPLSALNACLVS